MRLFRETYGNDYKVFCRLKGVCETAKLQLVLMSDLGTTVDLLEF